jgi:hypothetical protein
MNDQDFIFHEYLKVLEEGIKSQAGVGGTTGPTSPEEVANRATRTKRLRLEVDKENGKYFNVLELIADVSGKTPEQVKKAITQHMGSEKVKSQLNPMEAGWLLDKPYTIPLMNLPNRILAIRGLKDGERVGPYKRFLTSAEKALSALYEQEFGKKAEDIQETDKVLSFDSRTVSRITKDGSKRTSQERARVGGSSKDEKEKGGKFTHITNSNEDTSRLNQYSDKSFGFDPRGSEKPELPEPQRQQDAERILNNKILKYQYDLMKQGKTGQELKDAVQKFRAEQAVQNRANIVAPIGKPKKPTKKKVNKESYFIKVIPF